jgi:hypothetical protein
VWSKIRTQGNIGTRTVEGLCGSNLPGGGPVVIDHVCWLVADADTTTERLRQSFGLSVETGRYYPRAGTQHFNVWLRPPQLLEFMIIVDRQAAQETEAGRSVLACEARGYGLFSWAVLVDDLEAVSERLAAPIDDYTAVQSDGTLRGWRTVSGPDHLPFFIDYPNNGNRAARIQDCYERSCHRARPSHFSALTIRGAEEEMLDWLGPQELPLTFLPGKGGIVAAEITTDAGPVVIH